MRKLIHIFILLALINIAEGQVNWSTRNLFEQKNFIENKGQVHADKLPNSETVLYTAHIDGVTYYFARNGYTISYIEKQKTSEKEIGKGKEKIKEKEGYRKKGKKEEKEEEEKEFQFKAVEKFYELKWNGANENAQVLAEGEVKNYYSYSDLNSSKKNKTIIAHAFKRITYKELYPFTDVVFEFPADSTGIKYSIYLHPGADVEKIRMSFPHTKFDLDATNDLIIHSVLGNIKDHAPVSYVFGNGVTLKSGFKAKKNEIGFYLQDAPLDKTIIIDPWTVTPAFDSLSSAFDIDYDSEGNVYAYGGSYITGNYLLKYNSSGTLIWSYNTFTGGLGLYGDFAVDRETNSIYIIEGYNVTPGANVVRINSDALTLSSFAGDPNFLEMWRIAFSDCTHQAVIGGGGVSDSSYQTCYVDSNLTALSPVSYNAGAGPGLDVALLALDNYGNCYQLAGASDPTMIFNNQLVKMPLPALLPITYHVNTNYAFSELASVQYTTAQGFNGLTTSGNYVFSYDSYVLKKWDGSTGNLLSDKRIHYPAFDSLSLMYDSSKIYWGGISADDCGNLFVADSNMVLQYDSTLTLINSYVMPGVIVDVNLSVAGQLYVCGLGFVSSFTPTGIVHCTLAATLSVTNASCNTAGSVAAVVAGGTLPLTYTWNTVPVQHTPVAINLLPGNYTVSITDGSCSQNTITASATVNLVSDPMADFTMLPTEIAIINSVISFSDQSTNATNVTWNFDDPDSGANNTSALSAPIHTYAKQGKYCITLIASNAYGCVDTLSKCIEIINKIEIPNVFTPNGDTKNDVFYIQNLQLGVADLKIYNRWGNLMYSSSGYNCDWNGQGVSDGVYYYTLNYPVDGKIYKGFLHLIR